MRTREGKKKKDWGKKGQGLFGKISLYNSHGTGATNASMLLCYYADVFFTCIHAYMCI